MDRLTAGSLALLLSTLACQATDAARGPDADESAVRVAHAETPPAASTSPPTVPAGGTTKAGAAPPASDGGTGAGAQQRAPNELGRIPILQYHLIGETEGRWERHRDRFRADLELLHARGYRPVTVSELVDRRIDLPAGLSPVVVTFDDASPSHFRYLERDGELEIDPTSAVGIWLDFNRRHPDWENKAVFCLLSGAEAGRSFFGDKNIEGQRSEWRFRKVRFLAERGFELCNHTLWHANLGKYPDDFVQEQIARGMMAIDSAVPGYRVRTFALPLGVWPKNRELARSGVWREPRTGREVRYAFEAILLVSGDPVPSPHDAAFNPLRLERVQVIGDRLEQLLDRLDRTGSRYVSDGDPTRVTAPAVNRVADALR